MPAHETVQSSHFSHQLISGTQVQVVGVRQHQVSADFFELLGSNGFDRPLGAYRCENRGGDGSVRGVEDAGSGASLPGQ